MVAPSIACNNKRTKRDRFMVYLLIKSTRFSTLALMRFGIPNITLHSVSTEMLRHAE